MGRALGRRPLVLALWAAGTVARGFADDAPPPSPRPVAPTAEDVALTASPRASLKQFIDLARAGSFAEAAGFLDVPPERAGEGPELARRLKAVLDRHLWFDFAAVSDSPEGSRKAAVPAGVEELGSIPDARGALQSVRLVKRESAEGARWVFSRRTVGKVDEWYALLPDRWLLDHLPAPLLRPGPREFLVFQWIALPFLAALSFALGGLLGRL